MKPTRLFTFTATVSLLLSAVQAWSDDAPPAAEQKPKWQSSAAAGLTLTRGNSSTMLATAAGATVRKWDQNELSLEADLTKDKRLALRTYLQDTYNNQPAAGRQKNDAKLVTAIAYKF